MSAASRPRSPSPSTSRHRRRKSGERLPSLSASAKQQLGGCNITKAISGWCACFWVFLLLVCFPISWHLVFPDDTSRGPGDGLRRKLTLDILAAFRDGNWDTVSKGVEERISNGGLIIGNASGVQFEKELGWIQLGGEYAIASETKMITSLTIYKVIEYTVQYPNGLRPQSRVNEFIESWSKDPTDHAYNVTLEHLLSFTTGFDNEKIEQVKCFVPRYSTTWAECVDELAAVPITYKPGKSFRYGAFHLVVAAAMAMKALGKNLETSSWEDTVRELVYEPVGIVAEPDFSGCRSDFPYFFPWWGNWFKGPSSMRFPDFAAGMRMTGREYAKILDHVQFRSLLEPVLLDYFTKDHTTKVTQWTGHVGPPDYVTMGTWHYAQGCWLSCDEASTYIEEGWTYDLAEYACQGRGRPIPRVVHSLGFWGFYAWMDFTDGFWGVFVYSWAVGAVRMMWLSFCISFTMATFWAWWTGGWQECEYVNPLLCRHPQYYCCWCIGHWPDGIFPPLRQSAQWEFWRRWCWPQMLADSASSRLRSRDALVRELLSDPDSELEEGEEFSDPDGSVSGSGSESQEEGDAAADRQSARSLEWQEQQQRRRGR